jgi:hypothetical protein
MSLVGTDEGGILEKKLDHGVDLKSVGYGRLNGNPQYMVFVAVVDLYDRHHQTVPLFSPRLSSSLLLSRSPPLGRLDFMSDGRRLARALPWRCFPDVRP